MATPAIFTDIATAPNPNSNSALIIKPLATGTLDGILFDPAGGYRAQRAKVLEKEAHARWLAYRKMASVF